MNRESEINFDDLNHRYVIGVDLGTTNSAVAYVDLAETDDAQDAPATNGRSAGGRTIHLFPIPQLVAASEMGRRPVLPSFLYLPGEYDLPPGSTALPWAPQRTHVVGEFAREQGARVPGRLVASAKSWLAHGGVDRTAPILPWGAKEEIPQVSPVEASCRYLQHIREAWNAEMAAGEEEKRFEAQRIVLTVPASFDEVARELTVTAAQEAGIAHVVLLEEPLAAFYAWLAGHEQDWQTQMADGQLILVCDVGGGTTDFSIVGIRSGATGLRFDRLAVGEHLLLGGDNMDMTLGRHLETELMGQPGKLDTQRWHQLVYQCRQAKETLLNADDDQAAVDITVVGAAGNLIGGTRKGSLSQEDVARLILDGFFPDVSLDDAPDEARRGGLTELGLPYVQDPAITRHLALFWQRFQDFLRAETGRTTLYPDFILFNGGTLIPAAIRARLQAVIRNWFRPVAGAGWTPQELRNPRPDLAVATGAAYYGLVRLGEGVRVGSGSPRAYYVAVESQEADRAGETETAVCLVPRGTEEGFAVQLDEPAFQALTNQPVSFQVFTSSTRLGDQLGDVVQLSPDEISVLPPIRTVLRYGKGVVERIPVRLAVRLTEVGTLALWCQAQESEHRWQLEFDVREAAESTALDEPLAEVIDQALIEAAQEQIEQTFTGSDQPQHAPERLRDTLETSLGLPKEQWPTTLIRPLTDTLLDCVDGRALSPEHEARWLNLLGYCLRPGYGDPVDEWRMKQVWRLHFQGLEYPRETQCRFEWWVLWRRVAGGLSPGQQTQMYHRIRPYIEPAGKRKKKPNRMFPKHLSSGEKTEIWMALANFEWLSANVKVDLGRKLLRWIEKNKPTAQELWALSRLGARNAVYGPLDRLIPPEEAVAWLERLLALDLAHTRSSAQALVLLARYTGDRARDIPDEVRARVAQWLAQAPDAERYQELLSDPQSSLRQEEEDWIFGDTLPAGLVLFQEASG